MLRTPINEKTTVSVGTNTRSLADSSTGEDGSQADATRCVLYNILVCILSGKENAAIIAIGKLREAEGASVEHVQLLKRAATEQHQHVAVWTLNELVLEAKEECAGSSITHERAGTVIEGVVLLVHALNTSPSGCQGVRNMVEGLLTQLPFVLQTLHQLVRPSDILLDAAPSCTNEFLSCFLLESNQALFLRIPTSQGACVCPRNSMFSS